MGMFIALWVGRVAGIFGVVHFSSIKSEVLFGWWVVGYFLSWLVVLFCTQYAGYIEGKADGIATERALSRGTTRGRG